MNKLAKIAMLASAFFIPHVANAAVPTGPFYGTVVVHKGLTLTCDIEITIDTSGTPDLAYISLVPGDFLCAFVDLGGPYPVTITESSPGSSSGTYTIYGVEVTTITSGGCEGDVSGTWSGTTLDIDAVLPPADSGTGDCSIEGSASE
ncbi:hypothetical protein [Pedomonas mirosovicensis]|mgnify:CR=1 FL=1|uniref:hypothetical protein n=1 Tax=Pedomonas mirosovicensis TaxID=2908641 RepID=UPI0021687523|nr:hypothetical protein [Pedomonas mirosovicensis]MCH8686511.1 hypothetical protein [Pedomonas mirosovicensis]